MPSSSAKAASIPIVYWDACVFISKIQGDPERIDMIEELVGLAKNDKLIIVTSVITEGEVIKWPSPESTDPHPNADQLIDDFFKNPWIHRRTVDGALMGHVRRLRAAHKGLKLPDAIHVATALRYTVSCLHTYDHDDLIKRSGKLSLDGKSFLRIAKPDHPGRPLFNRDPDS